MTTADGRLVLLACDWVPVGLSDDAARALVYGLDEVVIHDHAAAASEHLLAGVVRSGTNAVGSLGLVLDVMAVADNLLATSSRFVEIGDEKRIQIARLRHDAFSEACARVSDYFARSAIRPTPRAAEDLAWATRRDPAAPTRLTTADDLLLALLAREGPGRSIRGEIARQGLADEVEGWYRRRQTWGALIRLVDDTFG